MAAVSEGDVALKDMKQWRAQLRTFTAWLGRRARRVEVRRRLQRYMCSVVVGVERRNGWQLAEAMGEATPDGVQRLWMTAQWDTDGMRDDLRSYAVEHLGDPEGRRHQARAMRGHWRKRLRLHSAGWLPHAA